MKSEIKQRYITSAFFMLISTVIVKVISAFYKIPLTGFIGAEGRGYFSVAYNLCLPIHALTMGAFPIALTKLISTSYAKNDFAKISALRKASKKLFFLVGAVGLMVMLVIAKPYTSLISSSPKSIYTVLALAPSIFFSCLCACNRSYAEGFLDMKATAVSQLIESGFKLIFGLLFAKLSMAFLINQYYISGCVIGIYVNNEAEALAYIYPVTSAFAMLGTSLGAFGSYIFASVYVRSKYKIIPVEKQEIKKAYSELFSFSVALVGATAVQSVVNFLDTSSIQLCLSKCSESLLKLQYNYSGEDVYTYVFGIFATALDFKNLIPSIVMALGVTAVPAVSAAYESSQQRFTGLINSIFKYSSIISLYGSLILALFSKEILELFYLNSNPDIVNNCQSLLTIFGFTAFPCAISITVVYCSQALGFAKETIPAFVAAGAVRIITNFLLITNDSLNIIGAAFSNFLGFFVILIWNMLIIKNKTKVKFYYNKMFLLPFLCTALSYFITDWVKKTVVFFDNNILNFAFCLIISVVSYAILLMLFKCVSIKDIRNVTLR